VFDSIVATAVRLLGNDQVTVMLRDGDVFSAVAAATPEGPVADARLAKNVPINASANFPSRAILDRQMLHLPDWSLIDLPEFELEVQRRFSIKAALYLPLLREGECIGLLTLVGKRPNMFGPAEIAQAESFRDQALIAIENTRLFTNCASAPATSARRWSSKQPRRTYCQLSLALPANFSRCLQQCWRRPSASAMPNSATSTSRKAENFA
jgi:GAF domain-containing protein